ncbi:MAG: oligosaccharide flippase family protein [Bacteroidales bacterium]|nr:oligosaccharide flippase family protein [Bacteroidales bacterium]MBN2699207.1 oligosaccharide flippase family protein [Bacteroidales bacterium]
MNPIRQLFGQTAVYGFGVVLPRLLNYLLLTPFYTRVFERAEYGVITELYAYVVFLIVILTYGMETGYFRYASSRNKRESIYTTVLGSLFITSLAFIVLIILFSVPIAEIIGYSSHPEYIRWLAVIVGIDAFTSIPFARLRLHNRPLKYSIIRILEVSLNILLNLFFLFYCPRHEQDIFIQKVYNADIGVGYVLISNLAASGLKLLLLYRDIIIALKERFDFRILKVILKYSYPLLIAGLAGTINEALDRVLLKHLIPIENGPMEQLGIYGANYKLAVLMTLFVQMFKYAAEPFFFSKSGEKTAKKLYADILSLFVAAGLFIFLLVTIYIDYFILFIGSDFREGVSIVPVVLMANLIMGIFFNLSIWYKLTNKTLIGAWLVIIGASLTVGINVLFIPRYGYVASAWAHLVCYSVMTVLSYLWSRKHYKIDYATGKIGTYILIALVLFGLDRILTVYVPETGLYVKPVLIISALVVYYLFEKRTFAFYSKKQD